MRFFSNPSLHSSGAFCGTEKSFVFGKAIIFWYTFCPGSNSLLIMSESNLPCEILYSISYISSPIFIARFSFLSPSNLSLSRPPMNNDFSTLPSLKDFPPLTSLSFIEYLLLSITSNIFLIFGSNLSITTIDPPPY